MTKEDAKTSVKTSEMFGLRTRNKKIIENLKKSNSPSETIENILSDFYNGKLIPIEEAKQTRELAELKFRDYKARIITKEIQARIQMIHSLKIPPNTVIDIMNNKKSLYNVTATKEIIQPDKTLRCFTCGHIIELRAYDFQQVDEYEAHVKHTHDRILYDNERNELLKVLGEIEH